MHSVSGVARIFSTGGGGGAKRVSEATERGKAVVPPPTVGSFLDIRVSKWHFLHIKCHY